MLRISDTECAKLHFAPKAQCPSCANLQSLVLWNVLVALSSSLLCAYLQYGFSQVPVWIKVLHNFVHVKSGSGFISSRPCAKGHCSPLAHMPMIWNLHILVLENCQVRVGRPLSLASEKLLALSKPSMLPLCARVKSPIGGISIEEDARRCRPKEPNGASTTARGAENWPARPGGA